MKVKIYLDYQCYPIWIYDEKGSLIDNDLPKEIIDDKQLGDEFMRLQQMYDSLFIDNSIEFKYNGFSNEKDKEKYIEEMNIAISKLKSKVGEIYKFEVKINL